MEYRLRSIISPAWICSYESLSDFRRSTSTLAGSFERTGRTHSVQRMVGSLRVFQGLFWF